MFYNFRFFAKPSMDFIQLWRDDRALSKFLCSTIPIPVHDLKIKVTDFEYFYVKSLQCQLLQSLWLIWIVFGMNGYKILKCFRKEKGVSGELPCPATGLISRATTGLLPLLDIKILFLLYIWRDKFNIWATPWQNQQNGMCAQRRLRSAWASAQYDQSSQSAWKKLGSLPTHSAHSKDSDQTGRIPRLIWVFARRTVILLVLSRGGSYMHILVICSIQDFAY